MFVTKPFVAVVECVIPRADQRQSHVNNWDGQIVIGPGEIEKKLRNVYHDLIIDEVEVIQSRVYGEYVESDLA